MGVIGFVSALTIALVVLKLIGMISWPWVWVLSPAWVPAATVFIVAVAAALDGIKMAFVMAFKNRKES